MKLNSLLYGYNSFLSKAKRLLKIHNEFQSIKNLDLTISSTRPPIFWKDKDLVKLQLQKWSKNSTKELIYKINEIELLVKKNTNNSINILSDFILEQVTTISN